MNGLCSWSSSGGRLSDYTRGRDDSCSLLRFVATPLMHVLHSFAICSGKAAGESLRALLGTSLGGVAVDISFLVAGSLLLRANLGDFVLARALRR